MHEQQKNLKENNLMSVLINRKIEKSLLAKKQIEKFKQTNIRLISVFQKIIIKKSELQSTISDCSRFYEHKDLFSNSNHLDAMVRLCEENNRINQEIIDKGTLHYWDQVWVLDLFYDWGGRFIIRTEFFKIHGNLFELILLFLLVIVLICFLYKFCVYLLKKIYSFRYFIKK
jgi:hypothetical protein